jgi:hypothetical protein
LFKLKNYFVLNTVVFLTTLAWGAKTPGAPDPAAGFACCGTLVFIPILLIALNIALLVWVARDAKARGMDSAVLWMMLVMFTSIFGLMIYLFSRPEGNVIQCANCHNRRLQASVKCPHCGAA